MGLLDGALGDAAGALLGGQGADAQKMLGGLLAQFGGASRGGAGNGLLGAAVALVQQHGLQGLVQKLSSGGLADVVQSWVGTGANAPLSAAQLEQVLGADSVAAVARQAGVSTQDAAGGLASMLPELVNQLTPDGKIPGNASDLLGGLAGLLKR